MPQSSGVMGAEVLYTICSSISKLMRSKACLPSGVRNSALDLYMKPTEARQDSAGRSLGLSCSTVRNGCLHAEKVYFLTSYFLWCARHYVQGKIDQDLDCH
eukprot:1158546-Pelagomonas_calceolata.AAC.7